MQALQAATLNAAIVTMRATDLGTIEPGKLADLVLLTADPLADIHNTRRSTPSSPAARCSAAPTSTPCSVRLRRGVAELRGEIAAVTLGHITGEKRCVDARCHRKT
jgi:Amidohydrolase family